MVMGRRRRGWFDAALVRQAIKVAASTASRSTKFLDVPDGIDPIKVLRRTVYRGVTLDDSPAVLDVQAGVVQLIYETLEGGCKSILGEPVPGNACPRPASSTCVVLKELIEVPLCSPQVRQRQDMILATEISFADLTGPAKESLQ